MSYKTAYEQTSELKADNIDQAIVNIEGDLSKSFRLKIHDVAYDDDHVAIVQLEDIAVNVVEVRTLHIHDYSDPYDDSLGTQHGTVHLFFPKKTEDGSARMFMLKLVTQENISIYFHEFNESEDITTAPPIIAFDTSEQLLGNAMMHCFIETTITSKASFYMKSKNCIDVVHNMKDATAGGTWTLMYTDEHNSAYSTNMSSYLETDDARMWHSGSSTTFLKPYVMFDKMKNAWIVENTDFGFATAWQSADAKSLLFPTKRAKAVWKEA